MSEKTSGNTLLTVLIPLIVSAIILTSLLLILILCAILRIYVTKETLEDLNQEPTYEEISDHKHIPMEENAAYDNITQATEDS